LGSAAVGVGGGCYISRVVVCPGQRPRPADDWTPPPVLESGSGDSTLGELGERFRRRHGLDDEPELLGHDAIHERHVGGRNEAGPDTAWVDLYDGVMDDIADGLSDAEILARWGQEARSPLRRARFDAEAIGEANGLSAREFADRYSNTRNGGGGPGLDPNMTVPNLPLGQPPNTFGLEP
jgi:hypothetical protein